ncbi:hypothetical protein TRVA0_027S01508 [Trichomonascus vanleenenianus]|uniref:uncharacterized protein n=1 Tax=Trichomonascus vanleenenianus TaxID=2268995 RepID=UPI003EC9C33D
MDSKELEKLRNCIEFEQVVQFVAFFGDFLELKEDFSTDALEEDLLLDGCELTYRLASHLAGVLLGTMGPGLRRKRSDPSLDEVLVQVYAKYELDYEAVFMDLSPEDKIIVIAQLVGWLSVTNKVREWVDKLSDDASRVVPIGREDNLFGEYYLFDDNRLYQRKVKDEVEEGWKCLCWDLDSWRGFVDSRMKTLRKKKRGPEREFIEYLKEQVLPSIEVYEGERNAKAQAREKQRALAMAVANRKRSSRLETKKLRQQEREDEVKRDEDEETLRKRRRLENKLRKQRDLARFERYSNYEKRKIQKEKQKEKEQHTRRRSRRATAATPIVQREEPEEDWWFDCSCGVYRDSRGGASMNNQTDQDEDGEAVCCDRCDTWMHFRCLSEEERRRVDLTKSSDSEKEGTPKVDAPKDGVEINGVDEIVAKVETNEKETESVEEKMADEYVAKVEAAEGKMADEHVAKAEPLGTRGEDVSPRAENGTENGTNGLLEEVVWANEYATSRNEFVCDRCVAWKRQELDAARQLEEERIRQEEENQRKAQMREEKRRAREELKRQKKKQKLLEEQMKRQEQLRQSHLQYQQQHAISHATPQAASSVAAATTTTTTQSHNYGMASADANSRASSGVVHQRPMAVTPVSAVPPAVDIRPVSSVLPPGSSATTTMNLQPAMVHHHQSVGASNPATVHQFVPYRAEAQTVIREPAIQPTSLTTSQAIQQPTSQAIQQPTSQAGVIQQPMSQAGVTQQLASRPVTQHITQQPVTQPPSHVRNYYPQQPPPNVQYTQFHHYNPQQNMQQNHGQAMPYQQHSYEHAAYGTTQNTIHSPTRNVYPSLSHTPPNATSQPANSVDNGNPSGSSG